MANYEIAFNMTGNVVNVMLKVEESAKKMESTIEKQTKKAGRDVDDLGEKFDKLKEHIIEAFAVRELIAFGKELMNLTAEYEGFENRVKFASLDTVDAGQNLAFMREEVEKLHLPMRQVYEGFSEMQAGLRGTGVEGERLRTLFNGISTAAATLHLPEYQLQRTLYDLKEIGEIGINGRIMRSLGTALPGIAPIIKETFGKGWKELEKEHISGAEFLNKLGPALQKNFSSGLDQYANSLQAKMTDQQNRFTQTQLELGEKLKPVFIEILSSISGALGKVSEFITYLSEHKEAVAEFAHIIEGAAIATVLYKVATQGATVAEKLGSIVRQSFNFITKETAVATEEATVATEGFQLSLGTTALGAFAVAIGLIAQAIMNYNSELDDAAEKLTGLKLLAGGINTTEKGFEDTQTSMYGINGMTDLQRGRVYADIEKKKQDAQDFLDTKMVGMLGRAEFNVHDAEKGLSLGKNGELLSANAQPNEVLNSGQYQTAVKAEEKLKELKKEYTRIHGIVNTYNQNLDRISDLGYTKPTYSNDPTGDAASRTTRLAGAEGGLGQAKTINIKIDRVMTVENHDNRNLTKHAEAAADYIIRAANNFSESQAGTQ